LGVVKEEAGSGSFLKKRTKKLLLLLPWAWPRQINAPAVPARAGAKVFCALFFKKALLS
jgi:hypothetical protein